jgi:hypothetical protein
MSALPIVLAILATSAQTKSQSQYASRTLTAIKADYYRANSEYLAFLRHPLKASVNSVLKTFAETEHNRWVEEARKTQKDLGKPTAPWELEIAMHVEFESSRVLTIGISTYTYTGGAHPNHWIDMVTFGMASGKPRKFALGDFFAPGFDYAGHISKLVIGKLASAEGADWVKSGEVKKLDAKMMQRFAPQKDGMVWFFNPYDVGPYAAGDFEVKLTLAELGPNFKQALLK